MKTYHPKQSEVKKNWYIVDLKGKTLGRVATEIARVLVGKNKPTYSPAADTGDFVVAINSDHIHLTGRKMTDKVYYRHTGHVGGIRSATAKEVIEKDSTRVIYSAVKGMLPKNKLGRHQLKKLKVYRNNEHEHSAQQPQVLDI